MDKRECMGDGDIIWDKEKIKERDNKDVYNY